MKIRKKISEIPVYLDGSDEWDNQCEYEEVEVSTDDCINGLAEHFCKKAKIPRTEKKSYINGFVRAFYLLVNDFDIDYEELEDKVFSYYEDEIKENL